MPATWDVPGGRIDVGTPLKDNLFREVLEETNILLSGEPRIIHAQNIMREDKHVVRLTFFLEVPDVEVKLDTTENTDYAWLFFEEMYRIPDLDPYLREAMGKLSDDTFPKLVRDNYPEIFKEQGIEYDYELPKDTKAHVELLKKKIVEEATEAANEKDPEKLKAELADCLEVIESIIKVAGFNPKEIDQIKSHKQAKKGSFLKGIIALPPS